MADTREAEKCRLCGMDVISPAAAFLHAEAHRARFGDWTDLGTLPYALFDRIAKLMEDYANGTGHAPKEPEHAK